MTTFATAGAVLTCVLVVAAFVFAVISLVLLDDSRPRDPLEAEARSYSVEGPVRKSPDQISDAVLGVAAGLAAVGCVDIIALIQFASGARHDQLAVMFSAVLVLILGAGGSLMSNRASLLRSP